MADVGNKPAQEGQSALELDYGPRPARGTAAFRRSVFHGEGEILIGDKCDLCGAVGDTVLVDRDCLAE